MPCGGCVGLDECDLEGVEGAVSFAELVKGLGLPVVAVWLGVLLGGFWVEQRGGFYDQAIWVGCL